MTSKSNTSASQRDLKRLQFTNGSSSSQTPTIIITPVRDDPKTFSALRSRQIGQADLKQGHGASQVQLNSDKDTNQTHPPPIAGPLSPSHVMQEHISASSFASEDSGYSFSPQISSSSLQNENHSPEHETRPKHLEIQGMSAASQGMSATSSECSDTDSPRLFAPPNSRRSSKVSSSSSENSPVCERSSSRRHRRCNTEPSISAVHNTWDVDTLGKDEERALEAAVRTHAVDFRDSTDWKMLLAHLFKRELVTANESDFLNSEHKTNIDKSNQFYFTSIQGKGPTAYRRLYFALKEETTHSGHRHLVEIMTDELKKVKAL